MKHDRLSMLRAKEILEQTKGIGRAGDTAVYLK